VADRRTIRIFISSPSDVRPERLKAEQIIARLDREFEYHFHVQAVLWERLPLVATRHFQDERNIPQARQADIVVVILWSRLGVRLPEHRFRGAISDRPVTGTEWEFEDAYAGARENGVPDLLLYRKTARITADLDNEAFLEDLRQQRALVQDFIGRWFGADNGGGYSAASHNFETITEFEEQLYDHLRELLERRAGARAEGVEIRWFHAPFRGLLPFEVEHAPVFFGRTRARNELRELLAAQQDRGCGFVLVLGASGSGKSSLVKAALLPDLMLHGMIGRVALVRYGLFRPSDAPASLVDGLAAAIVGPTGLPEADISGELAAQLRDDPTSIGPRLAGALATAGIKARLAGHAEARLVLVIDQLEELFTLDRVDPVDRDRFVAVLELLARSGLVWVIATMRSDFYDRIENLPGLARLAAAEACYRLLPPDDAELGQIIRRPALEAGLRFAVDPRAGVALNEVILEEASRDCGALPLLSFLLDQLWQRRTADGELTFAAYTELGGIEGALGRRAEAVFAAQPEAEIATLRDAFIPHLVRLRLDDGRRVRQPSPLAALPPKAEPLIRALTEARLLTMRDDFGQPVVEVAHEALFTAWPTLAAWLDEEQAFLADLERIRSAFQTWSAASPDDKPKALLRGLVLSNARAWVDKYPQRFAAGDTEALHGFVAASAAAEDAERARAQRQRRRLLQAVAAAALVFLVGFIVSGWQYYRAEGARRAAADRLAAAQLNESRFLFSIADARWRDGKYELAGLIARAALPADMKRPERPLLPAAVGLLAHARAVDRTQLLLAGHTDEVRAVSYSPDGARILTASYDRTARIWDAESGAPLVTLIGHSSAINDAAWSPDGRYVATASGNPLDIRSADDSLRIWDAATGEQLRVIKTEAGLTSVAWSPDGARLAAGSADQTARIWEAQTGAPLILLRGHTSSVQTVAWSPDGARLATASLDNTTRLWDAKTGAQLRVLGSQDRPVNGVAWSPDGSRLVTVQEFTAQVWDAGTGAPLAALKGHDRAVTSPAFSPDGKRVLTASADWTARVWDAESGAQLVLFEGQNGAVRSARWSPDGAHVVTGGSNGTARVWDANVDHGVIALRGHDKQVTDAEWSPGGNRIVTAAQDNTARVWDAATGASELVLRGHSDIVHRAVWSPDGARIATASTDKTARLWDASTGAPVAVLQGHTSIVHSVAFSPDGARLVTASADKTARVWDAANGALLATINVPAALTDAVWSPDGGQVLTIPVDGTARIFDTRSGDPVAVLQGHSLMLMNGAWSPDGGRVVTASWDHTARVWDAKTGAQLAVLRHGSTVANAAWSPDGRNIVTASWDKTVRIWDSSAGAMLKELAGHDEAVWEARYRPDGAHLATVSSDGTARLWDLETGAAVLVLPQPGKGASRLAWSPDGGRLVTVSGDAVARVWQARAFSTADLVTYQSISALRGMSRDERAAVFLADAAPQPSPDHLTTADCDNLAGEPFDPQRRMRGVRSVRAAAEAVAACRAALESAPGEPRLLLQLGRALYGAGRRREAVAAFENAAAHGSAAAADYLGDRYAQGDAVDQDPAQALRLYRQAAEGGFLPAFADIGTAYWQGIGVPPDHAEGLSWFRRGAERGDPYSHRSLAQLYENGEGVEPSIERAAFHHAVATRLFEAAGDVEEAQTERARRGSDIRRLAPDAAVGIGYEARAWQPATR